MISKKLEAITRDDLEQLVANKTPEGRTVEYKRDLNLAVDKDKRELARDVSSFANAAGGDLVFGADEAKDSDGNSLGYPDKIIGVECENFDQTQLRIESIVRDTIDPRVQAMAIHRVDGFERGPVIIVRIPKSWTGPHMVTYQNQTHFYSRNTAGKRGLDVREIRAAFLGGTEVATRLRRFRDERLSAIVAGEGPFPVKNEGGTVVVHVVPISDEPPAIDLRALHDAGRPPPLASGGGWNQRYNLDGLATYSGSGSGEAQRSYSQVFRNGTIEGVATGYVTAESPPALLGLPVETTVVKGLTEYLRVFRDVGHQGPVSVMCTLLKVRGARVHVVEWVRRHEPIDRDMLLLPDVLLDDPSVEITSALRPMFDAMWQAGGHPRSFGYSEDGKWDPRHR